MRIYKFEAEFSACPGTPYSELVSNVFSVAIENHDLFRTLAPIILPAFKN